MLAIKEKLKKPHLITGVLSQLIKTQNPNDPKQYSLNIIQSYLKIILAPAKGLIKRILKEFPPAPKRHLNKATKIIS